MTGRSWVAVVVLTAGVPLLMLVGAGPAFACSCAVSAFSDQVGAADVVFRGRVVGLESAPAPATSSTASVTWTFAVDRGYRGVVPERQPVRSELFGSSCGLEFEVGREYLVLAQDSVDGPPTTGLCTGTRPLADLPGPEISALGEGTAPHPDPVPDAGPLVREGRATVVEPPTAGSATAADAGAPAPGPVDRAGVPVPAVAVGAGAVLIGAVVVAAVRRRRAGRPG